MKIRYNNLSPQYLAIKDALLPELEKFYLESNFILGHQVFEFETLFASWLNTRYSIGVSNGTDAVKLALKSLKLSDAVIFVQANTYISTVLGAREAYPKASIVYVDIDDYRQISLENLDRKLKALSTDPRRKLILVTHMYGGMTDMEELASLATKYDAAIIEDCAQAHGTKGLDGRSVGSYGVLGTFSFYPGKNLGAFGDAGAIVTNNEELYARILKLRNLGQESKNNHSALGYNHRLDTIQSIVLKHKLPYLNIWNNLRIKIAENYLKNISNSCIQLPKIHPYCAKHTWHTFSVVTEDIVGLKNWLTDKGIEWMTHYPISTNKIPVLGSTQSCPKAEQFSTQHVSIPIHPFLNQEEQAYVCTVLNNFRG